MLRYKSYGLIFTKFGIVVCLFGTGKCEQYRLDLNAGNVFAFQGGPAIMTFLSFMLCLYVSLLMCE